MTSGAARCSLVRLASTVLSAAVLASGCDVLDRPSTPPPSLVPTSAPPAFAHDVPPPRHERTCCAFGMDMHAEIDGVHVPLFEIGNVIDASELTTHVYDLTDERPRAEVNGLVYTCRGGWIDSAHVRDSADATFYLATRIAAELERGTSVVLAGTGADSNLVVSPVSSAAFAHDGRVHTAALIAAWVAFRIALWHEVATWYGAEMVAGWSEQVSAFSVEDLYSDALGAAIGVEAVESPGVRDVETYEQFVSARIRDELAELGVVPVATSRAIMTLLDGRWWDSTRRIPEVQLVMRRAFPPDDGVVRPWLAADAFAPGAAPPGVRDACASPTRRTIPLTEHAAGTDVRALATLEWRPGAWADASLPFADPASHVVRDSELDALVARGRVAMRAVLGEGFDTPGPRTSGSGVEASEAVRTQR